MEMYKLDTMLEHPKAQATDNVTTLGICATMALMDNQQAKREDMKWLAGFFEGEGTMCLSQRSSGNGIQPTIAVTNTDKDLIEAAAETINNWVCGCHVSWYPERYLKSNSKAKPFGRIAICGYKRCSRFLANLIPFLKANSQIQRATLLKAFLDSRMNREFQRYDDTEIELAEAFWKVNSSRRGLRDQMPNIREKVSRMKIESAPIAKA